MADGRPRTTQSRRILVVEDDESVGTILLEELGGRGHDVTLARSFADGRRELRGYQADFDVVICDYDLGDAAAASTGCALINAYTGTGETILFSGLDRRREIARECPVRQPDRQWAKHRLPELIEEVDRR